MAFHPTHTFQKNRRFWMAAILMICMISFVFCTGMRGDMAERFGWLIGRGRGTVVASVGGHNVTTQELHDLKMQRNVANEFMRNCNEIAFKKVSKFLYEEQRRKDDVKNEQARKQMLAQLFNVRSSLYDRKAKPRYFPIGVKFDDLLEFKLWQATADKLGIQLDDEHVRLLFRFEFFSTDILDDNDVFRAQAEMRRNFQNINDTFVKRAIAEEFRVRMAQEAVLTAQPFQFYARGGQQGFAMKFSFADMPDEIRAPLTLAQLWEAYKTERAEFSVSLIPVHVDDFLKELKEEPTDEQKREFFQSHRDKPADPAADDRGLQLPLRIKVEYVTADPMSPQYLGVARAIAQLQVTEPIDLTVLQSPLAAATTAMAIAQKHRMDMQAQYNQITRPTDAFDYQTSPFGAKDVAWPIMTWLAKRHPEAVASMIAQGFNGPASDIGALADYAAWGALKHPETLEASIKAESQRRAPAYAAVIGDGVDGPFGAIAAVLSLDQSFLSGELQRQVDDKVLQPGRQYVVKHPELPIDAAMHEMEEQLAARAAEEMVQQNMQIARRELEKANGDQEKYRRVLTKLVPELNLTYGPAKKDVYFSRYTVNSAKELAPLRDAYEKYINLINFFEARDVTPDRLLKPGDFQKLFFDSSESFSATTPFNAMPWPPKAKSSNTRIMKPGADPRLIDPSAIREKDFKNFAQQMGEADPLKQAPELDLFKDAEKPFLFWRTSERIPERPADYADIDRNLKKYQAEAAKLGEQAKQLEDLAGKIIALRKEQVKKGLDKAAEEKLAKEIAPLSHQLAELTRQFQGDASTLRIRQRDFKDKETDLQEIKRLIVTEWRFERARSEKALPRANSIAQELLTSAVKTKNEIMREALAKLGRDDILLHGLAPMAPTELADRTVDYFKPTLPRDKIPMGRDDMMDQLVQLYNLKEPVKIGDKTLDDVNKALFDTARQKKNPEGEYVQILTNKPRSVYYVAMVVLPPRANPFRFNDMMHGIFNAVEDPGPQARLLPRDRFAERIQQQDAKAFRANVVAYLGKTLGFSIEKEEARKEFDERGGGD